jgi:toxin ParE1/3/4
MTRQLLRRPLAIRDIEECFVYIGEDNLEKAAEFLQAVEHSLNRITEQPFVGLEIEFPDPDLTGLRLWPVSGFSKYEIFYLVTPTTVDVTRVLHSARDIREIFS